MSTQPIGKSYQGPSGGLKRESAWLASEDIGDREVSVVIEDVEIFEQVAFDKGRVEERIGALKFASKSKRMVLNSTNRKTLVRLFGAETKAWRGQSVTLYVDKNVKMAGQRVMGLRIKSEPAKVEALS